MPKEGDAKYPEKKRSIVQAAQSLFLERGFAATSMDRVAEVAGVSKATVYSHFDNKEQLFAQIITDMCLDMGDPTRAMNPHFAPLQLLEGLGEVLLVRILRAVELGILQRVIGEFDQFPQLGRVFWESGPAYGHRFLSTFLEEKQSEGWRVPDPSEASLRFLGLVIAPWLLTGLLGVQPPPTRSQIRRHLAQVSRMFLSEFGPPGELD